MLHARALRHANKLTTTTHCTTIRRHVAYTANSRSPELRGTLNKPYTGGNPKWNPEMLKNLSLKNIFKLRSPLEPRKYKNIKELPTVKELGETDRLANPWSNVRAQREYFDTMLVENPLPPISAEVAPSLVSSTLMHDGTCKRFEMNKTECLNALDLKFTTEIRRLFRHWDDSPGILTFMAHTVTPGTMFCPGTDLRAILQHGPNSTYTRDFYHGVYNLAQVVHTIKKPCFVVADGPIFGNASAFLSGQFPTTTLMTQFAVPDVLVGFFPDAGIIHKLAPLNEMGRYIALTGRRLNYADMHTLGLAKFHIETAHDTVGIQTALGLLPDDSVYRIMSMMINMPIERPHDYADYCSLTKVEHLVKRVFKKRTVKLMMDELIKIRNEPETGPNGEGAREWAVRTLKRMRKASPVSLLVTLEYLNMVSRDRFTFEDCLTMDFRLSQKFVKTADYWEGAKAACERNRSAAWSHKDVDDVDMDYVYSFFLPMDDPRMEYKPMQSRPNDHVIDWKMYYDDFIEELTVPAPKPRIWNYDGTLSLGRMAPDPREITAEEAFETPSYDDIELSLYDWTEACTDLSKLMRVPPAQVNMNQLEPAMQKFRDVIMLDCFTKIRSFSMNHPDVPATLVEMFSDLARTIQSIMVTTRANSTLEEWMVATKDVVPIVTFHLNLLTRLFIASEVSDEFQAEAEQEGLDAYDKGLIQDVDYYSL